MNPIGLLVVDARTHTQDLVMPVYALAAFTPLKVRLWARAAASSSLWLKELALTGTVFLTSSRAVSGRSSGTQMKLASAHHGNEGTRTPK